MATPDDGTPQSPADKAAWEATFRERAQPIPGREGYSYAEGAGYDETERRFTDEQALLVFKGDERVGTAIRKAANNIWLGEVKGDTARGTAKTEIAAQRFAEHHATLHGDSIYRPQPDSLGRDPVYLVHNEQGTHVKGLSDDDGTAKAALLANEFFGPTEKAHDWHLHLTTGEEKRSGRVDQFQKMMARSGRAIEIVRDAQDRLAPPGPDDPAVQAAADVQAQAPEAAQTASAPAETVPATTPQAPATGTVAAPTGEAAPPQAAPSNGATPSHAAEPDILNAPTAAPDLWEALNAAQESLLETIPSIQPESLDTLLAAVDNLQRLVDEVPPAQPEQATHAPGENAGPAAFDSALRAADAQADAYRSLLAWQKIQQIRQATRHLWETAREKAGAYWDNLNQDVRWQGFRKTVAIRSTDAIARWALAGAGILSRQDDEGRRDLPGAAALRHLSRAASNYSASLRGRPDDDALTTGYNDVAAASQQIRGDLQGRILDREPDPYRSPEEALAASGQVREALAAWQETEAGQQLQRSGIPEAAALSGALRSLPTALPDGTGPAAGPLGEAAEAAKALAAAARVSGTFAESDLEKLDAFAIRADDHAGRLSFTVPSGAAATSEQPPPGEVGERKSRVRFSGGGKAARGGDAVESGRGAADKKVQNLRDAYTEWADTDMGQALLATKRSERPLPADLRKAWEGLPQDPPQGARATADACQKIATAAKAVVKAAEEGKRFSATDIRKLNAVAAQAEALSPPGAGANGQRGRRQQAPPPRAARTAPAQNRGPRTRV